MMTFQKKLFFVMTDTITHWDWDPVLWAWVPDNGSFTITTLNRGHVIVVATSRFSILWRIAVKCNIAVSSTL